MQRRRNAAALIVLIIILLTASMSDAIRKGRLVGRVMDPEGNPIEGVRVTTTAESLPDFRETDETDKKGVFKVDFEEINVVYTYRFDKIGFQTLEVEHVWQKDGTERYDFTMYPGDSAAVEGMAPVSESNEAVAAFNAGVVAFQSGDAEKAAGHIQEAVELDPELRQGWEALCVVLNQLARNQEAAAAAERAIELGSTHEAVLKARYDAYRSLGDEARAAEALEALEAAGQAAEEAKRVFNEGVALSKVGDDEGAFAKYREASALDPNLEIARLAVATAGLKIGRNDEALEAARAILDEDPGNREAIRIRYNAALALGREELILDALVSLAAVEPETAENGLWALAMAAYNDNDLERARERFDRLLEVNPDRARAHYYLGLMYVTEQDNPKAIEHLQRFRELAPDDPEASTAAELVDYLRSS